jgi:hypothetical protein
MPLRKASNDALDAGEQFRGGPPREQIVVAALHDDNSRVGGTAS